MKKALVKQNFTLRKAVPKAKEGQAIEGLVFNFDVFKTTNTIS
jgi:hypothetical protein